MDSFIFRKVVPSYAATLGGKRIWSYEGVEVGEGLIKYSDKGLILQNSGRIRGVAAD